MLSRLDSGCTAAREFEAVFGRVIERGTEAGHRGTPDTAAPLSITRDSASCPASTPKRQKRGIYRDNLPAAGTGDRSRALLTIDGPVSGMHEAMHEAMHEETHGAGCMKRISLKVARVCGPQVWCGPRGMRAPPCPVGLDSDAQIREPPRGCPGYPVGALVETHPAESSRRGLQLARPLPSLAQ